MRNRGGAPVLRSILRALVAGAIVGAGAGDAAWTGQANRISGGDLHPAGKPGAGTRPTLVRALKNDVSPPLKTLEPKAPVQQGLRTIPIFPLPNRTGISKAPAWVSPAVDPALQDWTGVVAMPAPLTNFEGVNNVNGVLPPDTNGDVGPNHYVQWVNISFAIWDKSGTLLYGPAAGNTLWSGFGGICETNNDGDPIVLYDHLADRWLMSQFAHNFPNDFHQCIAVSRTGDPTGSWYRYDFLVSNTKINDYPKFGVWPDAYYMAVNQFDGLTQNWAGQGVAAFERDKMLAGLPASMVYFDLFARNPSWGGMLPSDLDGPPPPAGAPNYFVEVDDDAWGGWPTDRLQIWKFHVDWANPSLSSFTGPSVIDLSSAGYPFDANLCGYARNCIPQPGGIPVDSISDRLMYRLAYRNFGDHEALVVNHTVDVDGTDHAGVRWYEIRDPGGSPPTLYQAGTFAPDANHRWMGSIAMDAAGNMALGYSVSGSTTYPSVRYVGRLAGDALGTLPQGETELIAGGGSQSHDSGRWGDYSMMAVDPVDDCTFWYTQEYYATSSPAGWQTRIGSFKFPSCEPCPSGRLEGTVTNADTGDPIPGAQVEIGSFTTLTDAAGFYQVERLCENVYDVTASAYGFAPATASGVSVVVGATTVQDFTLSPLPAVTVNGTVADGSGQGWPLYARIDVTAGSFSTTIFTGPLSGAYSVELYEGETYTFQVSAVAGGYNSEVRAVTLTAGGSTEDFALTADLGACAAPGYRENFVYFEDFETDDGGFATSGVTSWEWGAPASGPGSAHSGANVWATSLSGNYGDYENGYTTSPLIDLSAYAGQTPVLSWWQWLETESSYDFASVEVSKDGGASWARVYGEASGSIDSVWTRHRVLLDPSYAVSDFRVRFRLRSDYSVTHPGYYVDDIGIIAAPTASAYAEDFESDGGGFTVSGTTSWEWGAPASGPGSAHSGANVWATSLSGNYGNYEDGHTTSPLIDLSAYGGQSLLLSWWQWLYTESCCDFASVEVSKDGGASWTRVYGEVSGNVNSVWTLHTAGLDPSYAVSDFRVRLRLRSDYSVTNPGYYVDDVSVSAVVLCDPLSGGLVVGHVYDANTLAGLNGATVRSDDNPADQAMTLATPDDPARDDGFYVLFSSLLGDRGLTASMAGGYGEDHHSVNVVSGGVVGQDFVLPAGRINASPAGFSVALGVGESSTRTLTLNNTGGLAAAFELRELNAPPSFPEPTGPFADHGRRVPPKHLNDSDARAVYAQQPPAAGMLAAGDVVNTWSTGLVALWGVGVDVKAYELWIGNIAQTGGDDLDYRFLTDGTNTGETIDTAAWVAAFAADMAYDPVTSRLWQVNVGGDNCVYELDPLARTSTGNRICPPFGTSERGLAYDPTSDTFYSGSWNDGIINHFDAAGTILDSRDVGLDISGLAFNPATGHLFATTNSDAGWDVYVLDVDAGYAILGVFDIPGLGDFDQAGLGIDCDGHLWAANQGTGMMIEAESGETGVCDWLADIPWLSELPSSGAIPGGTLQTVTLTFDATGQAPGVYAAELRVSDDTPYGSIRIPVTLEVQSAPPVTPVTVDLGRGAGRPGGLACVPAVLTTNGNVVAATSNDIDFDPALFSFDDCLINPAVGPGSPADKQCVHAPVAADTERVAVLGTANVNPIPDGVLYTAVLGVDAGAAEGAYPLSNAAAASDPDGNDLNATGVEGEILVTLCTGDCNGNGQVTIGEVIRTVNLFLGQPLCKAEDPTLNCPVADANGDGTVSIGEVIQSVNSFLSGCPAPVSTPTPTPTPTYTVTYTSSYTPTRLRTPTATPTEVPVASTPTPTATYTVTHALTATPTKPAPTRTPTKVPAASTLTPTATYTVTYTPSVKPTIPFTATATMPPTATPTATAIWAKAGDEDARRRNQS